MPPLAAWLKRRPQVASIPPRSTSPVLQFPYTYDMPDPDLVIRTSGERRISNFLCGK